MTMAASTRTPMASASPPSDMMFELTWRQYIGMKAASTAIGKVRIGISAERTQITQTANHVFRAAHFEDSPSDFIGAGANLFNDGGKRDAIGAQFVGIDIHLVLLDESPDGRDFGNARNGFKLIAQVPIL